MALRWIQSAYADLHRLYDFLEPVDPGAAARSVRLLFSRLGRIPGAAAAWGAVSTLRIPEVRRVLAAKYEVRYEVTEREIVVLRTLHTRENR